MVVICKSVTTAGESKMGKVLYLKNYIGMSCVHFGIKNRPKQMYYIEGAVTFAAGVLLGMGIMQVDFDTLLQSAL